jgi:hypothetical protein
MMPQQSCCHFLFSSGMEAEKASIPSSNKKYSNKPHF